MVPSSLPGVVRLRRVIGLTLVLGSLAISAAVSGGLDQIEALGGDGHSYAFEDVDSINLFNGNVNVTIPLASYDVGAHLSYSFTLVYNSGGAWKRGGGVHVLGAIPDPRSTAGLGWRLSLGDLQPTHAPAATGDCGLAFIATDGAEHAFYDTLHPWDPGSCSSLTWYTRDSSYLRLKTISPSRKDVEHPDGRTFVFLKLDGDVWRLSQIWDRFEHWVLITYQGSTWTVSDSLGRTHMIHWQDGGTQYDHEKPDYITQLDLAARGGARAKYDFHYGAAQNGACLGLDSDPIGPRWAVPLLYEVTHPADLENPWQMGNTPGSGYSFCGELLQVRLPSRGMLQWSYGLWQFPHYPDIVDGEDEWDPPRGVTQRRLVDSSGTVVGRWWYRNDINHTNPQLATATRTIVIPPDGAGCAVHHFSARDVFTQSHWAYGLPFTDEVSNSVGGLTLYLSQEIYASAGDFDCSGSRQRSIYVHYEREGLGGVHDANHRVYAHRTHYEDDPASGVQYVQTRFRDFDGLGHFRQTETKGNLHATGEVRIERTQYNRNGNQTLTVGANGENTSPNYNPPGSNMVWMLGVFGYQQQQEGNDTARQNYTFEGATGFLTSKRILRTGTSTGNQDVVVDYTRYPNGDPPATRGQLRGERWSIENQSTPDLWLHHKYQHGVLSETEYRKPGSEFSGLFPYRATIDRNSGLPTQTTDTSDVKTNYTYDLLGRVLEARPGAGGGACLTYSYTKASGNTGPKWEVVRGNESCSGNLGQRAIWYDVWGRTTHGRIRMADGSWTQKRTRYNARGWVTGEAAWGSSTWTDFLDFDAFGRPQTIRPPEGAAHDVRYEYAGDRTVHRGVSMNLFGASSDEMRIRAALEHYDSFGRLVKIDTPANPDGTDVPTWYQYDVGNRLTHVNFGGQERFFIYDNRGFLIQECHPEKGINGNGCVNYSGYDAVGNTRWKDEGSRRLTSEYDFAGRLTKISSDWDATVSQWFYDGGDGFGQGKVHLTRRTQRVNFPNDGLGGLDVVVQEKINYTGPAGAPTSHSLTFDLPGNRPSYGFLMGTLYNDAGQRTMKAYPNCSGAACLSNEPARQQYFGWARGFLTSVDGLASSITYHPQGLWETIVRTNGVTDHQSVWQGQGRPGRIWTSGAIGGNFNTGTYQYDGVGNVKRMGNDDFGHQRSGRLFYAEVGCQNSGEASCHRQRYQYRSAGHGNLYWVETRPRGGSPSVVNWQVDEATNRLNSASYDVAGNMVASSYHGELAYDSQDALVRMGPDGDNIPRQFVYTADGERVWTILGGGAQLIYARDLDGKLLRTYSRTMDPGEWEVPWGPVSDTIWRGSQRLAKFSRCSGTGPCSFIPLKFPQHVTLDHLGTPRLYTDLDGEVIQELSVFPFGREAPGTSSSEVNFTGHERDNLGTTTGVDDMDYMHARFYTPQMARFFSIDPVLPLRRAMKQPQSWNRYTYALNNPLKYIDPSGELWFNIGSTWTFLEGTDYIEEITVKANGTSSSTQVRGLESLVTFDGGALRLHNEDGTTSSFNAVSGRVGADGATQPGLQSVRNYGPIPEGSYSFDSRNIQSFDDLSIAQKAASLIGRGQWPGGTVAWGSQRVELTADESTTTYGRSGFFIHGGSFPGSAGCIDLCSAADAFFGVVSDYGGEIPVYVGYP